MLDQGPDNRGTQESQSPQSPDWLSTLEKPGFRALSPELQAASRIILRTILRSPEARIAIYDAGIYGQAFKGLVASYFTGLMGRWIEETNTPEEIAELLAANGITPTPTPTEPPHQSDLSPTE